jgi:hypothetical protein
MDILKYRRNVYSHNGEDGVLEYILKHLGLEKNGTCHEMGSYHNTLRLVKQCGYRYLAAPEKDMDVFCPDEIENWHGAKVVILKVDKSVPSWLSTEDKQVEGYTFVCTTGNWFFVRDDLNFPIESNQVEFPWWLDYDAKVRIIQLTRILATFKEDELDQVCQELPKYTRGLKLGYVNEYTPFPKSSD